MCTSTLTKESWGDIKYLLQKPSSRFFIFFNEGIIMPQDRKAALSITSTIKNYYH